MLSYMVRQRHFALFVEMRLGKTLVTVRRFNMIPWVDKILIVGPYACFNAWQKELHLEGGQSILPITGTSEERKQILQNPSRWYIINKEGFLSCPELKDIDWNGVIIDESRFISNPRSKASRFFVDNFRHVAFRGVLTGTPAPESDLEYFQQMKFLHRKYFDFGNYYQFRSKLFRPDMYGNNYYPTPEGKKYIQLCLAQNAYFLTRKNAGIGAIKIYQQRMVKLPPAAKRVYRTLAKEFVLEYAGREESTIFATTKHIWMRRLYGGSVHGKFEFGHKLDELVYLLKGELRHEKVIIACQFTDEVEHLAPVLYFLTGRTNHRIHGKFPKNKEDRDAMIKDFQEGRVQDLILQPECFKFSKDFSASKTMIFFSTPEGLETRMQFEDRILNVAKVDEPLLYIDIVCEGTTEEDIITSLILKEGRQAATRRMVQRLQKEAGMI